MEGQTARGLRLRDIVSFDGLPTVAVSTAAALAIFAFGIAADRFQGAPLYLLVLPLVAASVACGLRGGLGMGLLVSALAIAWWIHTGFPGGIAWLASRPPAALVFGGVLGWFVDARKRLLHRLSQQEALSLDLICTQSFDGYYTRTNPAFTRVLGYTAEELMAQPFLELVHPDDRGATLAAMTRQIENGEDLFDFQNRYLANDGSYRWLEWSSRVHVEAKELIGVARDVTDRKRLEQLEREHRDLLEQAVRERTEELHRRNAELDEARLETLRRLALAAEYHDDDTHAHTERVRRAAAQIAHRLGLPDQEIELLREAAALHDIGKLAIPDNVLLKPGKLTEEEFEQVKRHTETGAAILSGSGSAVLQLAAEIALAHHEWWDGSGYPLGLRGEEIPLSGRILALADVFDSLTHRRPYKPAWPVEAAVAEIHLLRGRQFDPRVVDAFDRLDPFALADQPVHGRGGAFESSTTPTSPRPDGARSGTTEPAYP